MPVRRDLMAGLLMVVAGAAVVWESASYGYGTLDRMGPGLFPTGLGVALVLVGLLIAISRTEPGEHDAAAHAPADWRGWCCIIGGIALFVVLGEYAGLAPATFACVLVSALGDWKATLLASVLLALGCTAMAALVFSMLLHFQLPLFRW